MHAANVRLFHTLKTFNRRQLVYKTAVALPTLCCVIVCGVGTSAAACSLHGKASSAHSARSRCWWSRVTSG